MGFCCEGLGDAFKSGFCYVRLSKSKEQGGAVEFAVMMGLKGVRMDFCPFCGRRVSVALTLTSEVVV